MTYYKDIEYGRTPRGSLISRTNDKVHLEIIAPEDMAIVAETLRVLRSKGIPYTSESKTVHSPKHGAYVRGIVIDYVSTEYLPSMSLDETSAISVDVIEPVEYPKKTIGEWSDLAGRIKDADVENTLLQVEVNSLLSALFDDDDKFDKAKQRLLILARDYCII